MMIPHHEQAVAMSDMLLDKSGLNAEVKMLATQIKNAQQPEIETMRGWLTDWGQPTMSSSGGMDHGDGDGMGTMEEMQKLDQADAAAGQKMYLQMMVRHHQGAIRMAQDEVAQGKNPLAVELARTIEKTQQAEITKMNELLTQL